MASKKKKDKQEKQRIENALKAAGDDAKRLFTTHERDRRTMEMQGKVFNDAEYFDRIKERDRLAAERTDYRELELELAELRQVALDEAKKHDSWSHVTQFRWLPDVEKDGEISAFLSAWSEEQQHAMGMMNKGQVVHMRLANDRFNPHVDHMTLQRIDTAPTAEYRRKRVDEDLNMCVLAVRLAEDVWRAADTALLRGDAKQYFHHKCHLRTIYQHIMTSLDRVTCTVSEHLEIFVDPEEDCLMKIAPPASEAPVPFIKYGFWLRSNEKRVTMNNNITFGAIGVSIDPKDQAAVRLPKALGLRQGSNTVRTILFAFDPCGVMRSDNVCQEWVALDCVLVVESIKLTEPPKQIADFNVRSELTTPPELHRNDYPPKDGTHSVDELTMRISFELPKSIVVRQNPLMIGKWNPQYLRWDQTTVAAASHESIRRFSFPTNDLGILAVIQEKGFDVPYEQWRICPITDDEVLFFVQGRARGNSDREIQIHVREQLCKLVGPDDPELGHIRGNWVPPATLLRLLGRAGFNFVLTDKDGEAIPHVLTKTKQLETKGYADIALFAGRFAVASSRHNKTGEDKDMALFRLSKDVRTDWSETDDTVEIRPYEPDTEEDARWHAIRYETERCVLAQFTESDTDANLSSLPECETHLNLFKCLAAQYGEERMQHLVKDSSPLLTQGIFDLLSLIRPFSWG